MDSTPELAEIDAGLIGLIAECWAWGTYHPALSTDQLDAFRAAVTPVAEALANDPAQAASVDRIADLRSEAGPGPSLPIPADCTGAAPAPPQPHVRFGGYLFSASLHVDGEE